SENPDDWEEISETMAHNGEYIALRIKGDSMEPRMKTGDVIIVRLQNDVDNGEIAVVRANGDEATCKKIKKTPEGLMLLSLNPEYEPIFYTAKQVQELPVSIIGKVVELRAKF
ncbi:MAG: LexA family protein, partial [Eubacteriales bacterium]